MSISRVKTWTAGEVLTANDLNNEFNNITNSALTEPFVATQAVDLNGQLLLLDADGDTLLDASTNNTVDITIGGADDFRFTANTLTALAGSSILLDQGDVSLVQGNVLFGNGRVNESDGGNVVSTAAVTVPTTGHTFTITGTTTVTSFSSTLIGTMLYVRFTGAGLNITHNAVSMIAPWGVGYRTIPNEVLCFLSLGSGTYTFWSMNGPKERVGQSVQFDSATAPDGFLPRDGAAVSRTTYTGLFSTIGTTHGVGDGSTTFNTPDGRGRVDVQIDGAANRITSASTNGANADTLGGVGGAETHTMTLAEMTTHDHVATSRRESVGSPAIRYDETTANNLYGNKNVGSTGGLSNGIAPAGGGGAHSNTQPWIAVNKYIRF